jgi:hypothetical protein
MLYQLSYASPSTRKPKPNTGEPVPKKRTDTLPLRTFNGTEIKVSTPPPVEQTGAVEDGNQVNLQIPAP